MRLKIRKLVRSVIREHSSSRPFDHRLSRRRSEVQIDTETPKLTARSQSRYSRENRRFGKLDAMDRFENEYDDVADYDDDTDYGYDDDDDFGSRHEHYRRPGHTPVFVDPARGDDTSFDAPSPRNDHFQNRLGKYDVGEDDLESDMTGFEDDADYERLTRDEVEDELDYRDRQYSKYDR